MTLYVNGEVFETIPNRLPPTAAGHRILTHRSGRHRLYDLQIYSRRLSLDEIRTVYNAKRLQGPECPRSVP